jgi:hypothetical protein
MSIFNSPADTPGRLNEETNQITLTFVRTGASTGTVSWNIPTSSLGSCSSATDGVYNGMVVTLGTTEATPLDAPVNGTIYNADPTGDPNINLGDRLGTQLVIGSFYNDKSTNTFNITGLDSNVGYYIQGYPVDAQFRYDSNNGVAAFERSNSKPKEPDLPAQQAITFPQGAIAGPDATNLIPGVIYPFTVTIGTQTFDINIDGVNASTYDDLITELNRQFSLLGNPTQTPFAPNTNAYYWSASTKQLFQWTGSQSVEITPILLQPTDPTVVNIGTYWFDPTHPNDIKYWDGATWISKPYINWPHNIISPACGEYWFNGTDAYQWEGDVWVKLPTVVQIADPCQANNDLCGAYWYNTTVNTLFKYQDGMWISSEAIYWPTNPAIPVDHSVVIDGMYWFDTTNSKLYEHYSTGWQLQGVSISTTQPIQPTPAQLYWYNPTTEVLKKYDTTLLVWVTKNVLPWHTDPAVQSSGDLWWNATNDTLYIWDVISNGWTVANPFYQNANDPRSCPTLIVGQMWYNTNNVLSRWDGASWIPVQYINNPVNPMTPTTGTIWHDTSTNVWAAWIGSWMQFIPINSVIDPSNIPTGTFWFNTATNTLYQRNGLTWMPVNYSTTSLVPLVGTLWFDSQLNILKEWNGTQWVETTGPAYASLSTTGTIIFTTKQLGGCAVIYVHPDQDPSALSNLFTVLEGQWTIPVIGTDGLDDTPMYSQYNVGDDFTTDERKQMAHVIRMQLGYPVVEVELTPAQLNVCIDNALQVLRKRSGIAYHRAYFFLDVKPRTQKYILTNKCVGFNTIVDIQSLHRLTSAFLSSAHGAGVFGQVMLQQLYYAGGFDMLTYDLVGQYVNQLEIQLSNRLQFNWTEKTRTLWIPNSFSSPERILVDANVERTEQDLLTDRWTSNWVQKFALAQSMQLLAQIRGKFASLPGAGGNISLNASDLQSQGDAMVEALLQQIDDYLVDHPEEYGMGSSFIFG